MAQCNWDPAKHNGKSCPVHGASGTENNTGHKLRINGGKYQVKYSDSSDYEDTDKETYDHLRATALQDFDENVEDDFGFDEDNGIEENSISKGLTDLGKKLIVDAREAGFGNSYDPMTGSISLSDEDLDNKKDAIKQWLNDHPDYKLVEDQIGGKWLTTDYENGEKELYDNNDELDEETKREYDEINEEINKEARDDIEKSDAEKIDKNPYTSPDDEDFRKGYKNQTKMPVEEFKSQFDRYGKGKAGYDYYSYGKNKGYVLSDEEGTTIGFYDLNNGTFYYEDSATEKMKTNSSDKEKSNNLDPNNPKYKGKSRSAITNAKLVDEGYEFTNANGEKVKESIIEYIPYGALQDGDNRKLYGIVRNYDGSDAPNTGAIVSTSLEDAKEQLESQVKLGIQGSDRYLGRGKYDEEFFNIVRDNREEGDDEKYKERYGWDFNKPFKEHDFMKDDPYEKWKSEREYGERLNKILKQHPEYLKKYGSRENILKIMKELDGK